MSLRVWLPLNRDLRNNGLENVTVTNNSATFSNNCAVFNGSSWIYVSPITLTNTASMTWWAKTTDDNAMFWVLDANVYGNLNFWLSGNSYYLNIGDSGNNPFKKNGTNSPALKDGIWHHYATIFNGTTCDLYIDGNYYGTSTTYRSPATPTNSNIKIGGYFASGHTYDFSGSLYDFRIYDHALSKKEVKELSKGLYLHYTFDDAYVENTVNLVPKGMTLGWGTRWQITTTYPSGLIPQGTVYKQINSDAYLGPASNFISDYNTPTNYNGKYITMSCWYYRKSSSSPQLQFYVYGNNGTQQYSRVTTNVSTTDLTNVGGWTYAVIVQQFLSDLSGYSSLTYFKNQSSMNDDFYMADVQIEIKDHATPYTPNSRTTTVLPDNSGFGNDGAINGELKISSDSLIRYGNSAIFNGSNTTIRIYDAFDGQDDDGILGVDRLHAYSFWIYLTSIPSDTRIALIGDSSNHLCFGFKGGNIVLGCISLAQALLPNPPKIPGAQYSTSNLQTNAWNHIAVNYSGTGDNYNKEITFYLNGQKQTNPGNDSLASSGPHIGGRIDNGWLNCRMSDVRIYTANLSVDNILDLYKTGCAVDKNQNLHCYELNEITGSDNKFLKSGVVKTSEFEEIQLIIYLERYDPITYDDTGQLEIDELDYYAYYGEKTIYNNQLCYIWHRICHDDDYYEDDYGGGSGVERGFLSNSLNLSLPFDTNSPEFVAILNWDDEDYDSFLREDERYRSCTSIDNNPAGLSLPSQYQGLCVLEYEIDGSCSTKIYKNRTLTSNEIYEN